MEVTKDLISQSEMHETYEVDDFNGPVATFANRFKKNSPMRNFEEKMSRNTRVILADIIMKYYEEQHPELDSEELESILGNVIERGFAAAVFETKNVLKGRELTLQDLGIAGRNPSATKLLEADATNKVVDDGVNLIKTDEKSYGG